MPAFNNYWANNQNGIGYAPPVNQWGNTQTFAGWNNPQPQQQPYSDYREFVHGRLGADAYQLKPGVTMQVLWDDEQDRFYIKGYDNNGRPRVLADNDFAPHVEPENLNTQPQIDLSPYATKDDIRQMITESISKIPQTNLSGYVTKKDFDDALNSLSVGNGGRIVRVNESNA